MGEGARFLMPAQGSRQSNPGHTQFAHRKPQDPAQSYGEPPALHDRIERMPGEADRGPPTARSRIFPVLGLGRAVTTQTPWVYFTMRLFSTNWTPGTMLASAAALL